MRLYTYSTCSGCVAWRATTSVVARRRHANVHGMIVYLQNSLVLFSIDVFMIFGIHHGDDLIVALLG